MSDEEFKDQVIEILDIKDLPTQEQDEMLGRIELLANTKVATALPELLSNTQYEEIEKMRANNKTDDEILDWVESNIPNYTEVVRTIILDIAQDLAQGPVV